jgi:hypothetical protein
MWTVKIRTKAAVAAELVVVEQVLQMVVKTIVAVSEVIRLLAVLAVPATF